MRHFFVGNEGTARQGACIAVVGSDVNHIRNVLRMKPEEQAILHCKGGESFCCALQEIQEEKVLFRILQPAESGGELPCRLYLFQGLPKGTKMEWIIQKAVELGIYQIVPVVMNRCVVKLDPKRANRKVARWNLIAESGAKQSGREYIPEVAPVCTFAQALEIAKTLDISLLPYEEAHGMEGFQKFVEELPGKKTAGIFIGPEGGFAKGEVESAIQAGVLQTSLGRRILRTETAGLAVLSVLMYHLECERHSIP